MSEDFERAWPYLEPAVVWGRQHTRDSVLASIESGQSQLWALPNSAVVTGLRKFPCGRKSFGIWLAGGEGHLGELVDWANGPALQAALDNNCNEMRVFGGRRGWVRVLGWREVGAIAIKDLDHV